MGRAPVPPLRATASCRAAVRWSVALLGLAACGRPDATVPAAADGEFLITTTVGDTTHQFSVPAQAGWCAARRELLVTAQRSDTGAGLLFAFDTAGWRADSMALRAEVASPRAALVWRIADLITLRAYRADSGWAAVDDSGRTASGRFGGRLVTTQSDGSPPIRVTGRFDGVPVLADTACVRRDAPTPAPMADSAAVPPAAAPSAGVALPNR